MEQDNIIKLRIEKQDLEDAKKISVSIDNEVDRKRAYASIIALRTFERYLQSIHMKVDTKSGLYQVPQFFQEFDLTDFYYKNINFDIRILYANNDIFVPKKHFEYSIQPDIYIAARIDENFLNVEIEGFFESRQMSKARSEKFYYLNSVENLRPINDLTTAIETITPITRTSYDFDHLRTQEQFLAYLDREISSTNKLKMVRHLVYCAECRENLITVSHLDGKMGYISQYPQIKNMVEEAQERAKNPQNFITEVEPLPYDLPEDIVLENHAELLDEPMAEKTFDLDDLVEDFDLDNFAEEIEDEKQASVKELSDDILQTATQEEFFEGSNFESLSKYDNMLPSDEDDFAGFEPLNEKTTSDKYDNMLPEMTSEPVYQQPVQGFGGEMLPQEQEINYEIFDSKLKDILEINDHETKINSLDYEEVPVKTEEIEGLKKDLNIDEQVLENELVTENDFLEAPVQEDQSISVLYSDDDINKDIIPDVEIESLEKKYRDKKPQKDLKGIVMVTAAVVVLCVGVGLVAVNKDKITTAFKPKTVELTPNTDIPEPETGIDEAYTETPPAPGELPKLNADTSGPKDINKAMTDVFSTEASAVSITKISWEVPEDLAKNDVFKKYLQIAGKNLQLNLQNDLLLASDFAYNDKVKVFLQIEKTNKIKGLKIVESSGSDQIDNIVLQSIKDTLKYINLPVINSKANTFELTLIINF